MYSSRGKALHSLSPKGDVHISHVNALNPRLWGKNSLTFQVALGSEQKLGKLSSLAHAKQLTRLCLFICSALVTEL